jgi:hypothetical protein
VLSLLRTTGTGPLQSVWEEDARDVLDSAINSPGLATLFRPAVGYVIAGPRLLGLVATLFPLSWAAAVLSISAALLTALMALQVYRASAAYFPGALGGRVARIAVSAPLLVSPVAENRFAEVFNRPVCLHFFAVYAIFWVLLWTPRTRAGRAGALLTIGLTGLSTILIVGCLPLAGLRLALRRDRWSATLAAVAAAGSTVQIIGALSGLSSRGTSSTGQHSLLWTVENFVAWAVPQSVFGFRATTGLAHSGTVFDESVGDHIGLVAGAWVALGAVVLAARFGARLGWVRPAWTLAATAAAAALWMFAFTAISNGAITNRYLLPVQALLFAAAVALLRPAERTGARATPVEQRQRLTALATLLVLALVPIGFNYRFGDTHRAAAPRWSDQVRLAGYACASDPAVSSVVIRGGPLPYWSIVTVPCHDMVRPAACVEPTCVWLDRPTSLAPLRRRVS